MNTFRGSQIGQGSLFIGTFDEDVSRAEGQRGMELANRHLKTWKEIAFQWVLKNRDREFTADDLVKELGLPTDEEGVWCNNGIGGLINQLYHHKPPLIWPSGYTTSTRVTNHGRVLRIWRVL